MDTTTALILSTLFATLFLIVAGVTIYIAEFFARSKKSKDVDIYEPYGYGKYRKVER
ncbi:hypothetical protein NrS5_18 [Nitratiruptor phage NrS-5]|uniref:hypothetical protein n=1 Tax=unclassified Nitratiruptor TaxID=2624044 RepID=UPI001915B65D|nr:MULTISPECIES: hypothetical protein [unclassified Nitratiruptor]BCD61722.1 hypothetical protein NitYY0813_C0582 [Nitratiruptor sp. YY08-13]BCD65657.1 hypothetical protein NitYY0826_C0584 [Nitratiruptor sp. YY08-26]BCD83200.1 hypothetical protein NrS4_18 [Nitratiruptor phage NrS-4]BCD83259.1 hypothetical protein NrS5_18 [Nitratiruptor phage NrS-5]